MINKQLTAKIFHVYIKDESTAIKKNALNSKTEHCGPGLTCNSLEL